MGLKVPVIADITDPNAKVADPLSWASAAKDTIDLSNLGIPGAGTMTGQQAFITLEKLALHDPAQWGNIRDLLVRAGAYGNHAKAITFSSNWTSQDETAVKNAITSYHVANLSSPADPKIQGPYAVGSKPPSVPKPSFLSFAMQQAQSYKTQGTAVVPKLVSVPATADLEKVAQDAFSATLGRSASAAEVSDFAKKYQDLVFSYGDAKNDAKKASVFTPPAQPIQFQPNGQAPIVQPKTAPVDSTAIIEPPTASVAAANFAAKTNPTQASAQAAADGLNQFMSMLKG